MFLAGLHVKGEALCNGAWRIAHLGINWKLIELPSAHNLSIKGSRDGEVEVHGAIHNELSGSS